MSQRARVAGNVECSLGSETKVLDSLAWKASVINGSFSSCESISSGRFVLEYSSGAIGKTSTSRGVVRDLT
jgi:hypothetical protein